MLTDTSQQPLLVISTSCLSRYSVCSADFLPEQHSLDSLTRSKLNINGLINLRHSSFSQIWIFNLVNCWTYQLLGRLDEWCCYRQSCKTFPGRRGSVLHGDSYYLPYTGSSLLESLSYCFWEVKNPWSKLAIIKYFTAGYYSNQKWTQMARVKSRKKFKRPTQRSTAGEVGFGFPNLLDNTYGQLGSENKDYGRKLDITIRRVLENSKVCSLPDQHRADHLWSWAFSIENIWWTTVHNGQQCLRTTGTRRQGDGSVLSYTGPWHHRKRTSSGDTVWILSYASIFRQ